MDLSKLPSTAAVREVMEKNGALLDAPCPSEATRSFAAELGRVLAWCLIRDAESMSFCRAVMPGFDENLWRTRPPLEGPASTLTGSEDNRPPRRQG